MFANGGLRLRSFIPDYALQPGIREHWVGARNFFAGSAPSGRIPLTGLIGRADASNSMKVHKLDDRRFAGLRNWAFIEWLLKPSDGPEAGTRERCERTFAARRRPYWACVVAGSPLLVTVAPFELQAIRIVPR